MSGSQRRSAEASGLGGRLQGKIAIVAGAGSSAGGISNGMATALVFAREGATVFAVDLKEELAQETCSRITAQGGLCHAFTCDVTSSEQVTRMVEACVGKLGRVDILFNNVGASAPGGLLEESLDSFERTVRLNLTSMFLTCQSVLEHMLRQRAGVIVNNASVAGMRTLHPKLSYAASKAAVIQLTQNIGVTYARHGIRCNAVLPGFIASPRLKGALSASGDAPDEAERRETTL